MNYSTQLNKIETIQSRNSYDANMRIKINTTIKAYLFIYFISYVLINTVSSIASQPFSPARSPYIQSHQKQIYQSSRLIYDIATTVTYNKAKLAVPTRIYYGIKSMDTKALNFYPVTSYQWSIQIQLKISLIYKTQFTINFHSTRGFISVLTISILVFDNSFPYISYIQQANCLFKKDYLVFNFPGFSIPYPFTTYKVVAFLNYMYFQTFNQYNSILFQLVYGSNGGLLTATLQIPSLAINNYMFSNVIYNFMVILNFPTGQLHSYVNYQLKTAGNLLSPFQLNLATPLYYGYNSNVLFGLVNFQFSNLNINKRIKITSINIAANQSRTIQLSQQFIKLNYNILVFNYLNCNNPLFPLKASNITNSNTIQCFDQCYDNYYLQWYNNQYWCMACNTICMTCDSLLACTTCYSNYTLDNTLQCVVKPTHYQISANNTDVCNKLITGCLLCVGSSVTCSECMTPYYLNVSTCKLCSITIPNCISCLNSTVCLECNPSYHITNISTCANTFLPIPIIPCTNPITCLSCNSTQPSQCYQCNLFFQNNNGNCINVCGDGYIVLGEQCDDANVDADDGCDQICRIQHNWICDNSPQRQISLDLYYKSTCYYNHQIQLQLLSVNKVNNLNQVQILLKNKHTNIKIWSKLSSFQLKQMFKLKLQNYSMDGYHIKYSTQFSPSSGLDYQQSYIHPSSRLLQSLSPYSYILLTLQYSYPPILYKKASSIQSLNRQMVSLEFQPSITNRTQFKLGVLPFDMSFQLKSDDNQIIQYYPQQYYDICQTYTILSMFVMFAVGLLIAISFIAIVLDGVNSRSIWINIQTISLIQLTYISLSQVGQLNPLLSSMAKMLKFSLTISVPLIPSSKPLGQHQSISIQSYHFFNNTIISLFLILIFLLIGVGLFLWMKYKLGKFKLRQGQFNLDQDEILKIQRLKKYSNIFVGNFAFGFFSITAYQLCFYFLLQIKYAIDSIHTLDIIAMSIFVILIVTFISILVFRPKIYSELTDKILNYIPKQKIISDLQDQQQSGNIGQKIQYFLGKYSCKRIYPCILLSSALLNSLSVVILSQVTIISFIIPITCSIILILYITITKCLNQPNYYRQLITQSINIFIQLILMIRKNFLLRVTNYVGYEEKDFGTKVAQSILIVLIVLVILAIIYAIYSINKIRCFHLEIDWQGKKHINRNIPLKQQNKNNKKRLLDSNESSSDSQTSSLKQSYKQIHQYSKISEKIKSLKGSNKQISQKQQFKRQQSKTQQLNKQQLNKKQQSKQGYKEKPQSQQKNEDQQSEQCSQSPSGMHAKVSNSKINHKQILLQIKQMVRESRIQSPQRIKRQSKKKQLYTIHLQNSNDSSRDAPNQVQQPNHMNLNQKTPAYKYTNAKYSLYDQYNNI